MTPREPTDGEWKVSYAVELQATPESLRMIEEIKWAMYAEAEREVRLILGVKEGGDE